MCPNGVRKVFFIFSRKAIYFKNVHSSICYTFAFFLLSQLLTANAYASVNANMIFTQNGQLQGWLYDTSNPSISLNLNILIGGPIGKGVNLASFTSNDDSTGVNEFFNITGIHRFTWNIPNIGYNAIHYYYVYTIDLAGNTVLLNGGPITFPVVAAAIYAQPELVFDADSQACDENDFPDHPARAFRTADGNVTLLASWIYVRRSVGKSLNSLTHKCDIIYTSTMDPQYDHFDYYQWLQSPYTVDGKTIFNITHNEWYANLVDGQCNGDLGDGWISALSLTISDDMGKTFHKPLDRLIRNPSSMWDNKFPCNIQQPTRYGDLGGSNVIFKDGFYYKFFYYEPEPLVQPPVGWNCLLRTKDLSHPGLYQILTQAGWIPSKTSACMPIGGNVHFRSVTYNTYLQTYVAIEQEGPNFYFCLSKNLTDWTAPNSVSIPNQDTTHWMYPSLLDPQDTSLNFENTGRGPFLYFMLFNDPSRKQMRVRLIFDMLGTPGSNQLAQAPISPNK